MFIISSVIFFVGNCIYLAFGTAVSQPWDAEDFLQQRPLAELALPAALPEKADSKKSIS